MYRLSRHAPLTALRIAMLLVLVAPPAMADPHYPPPQLPAVYDDSAGRSPLPRQALDRWWLLFDDPALNALEDEALQSAPDALTQEARLIEARATFRSEIDQTLPQGEINGSASQQTAQSVTGNQNSLFPIGGVTTIESATFSPSWEIDFFGRLAVQRAGRQVRLGGDAVQHRRRGGEPGRRRGRRVFQGHGARHPDRGRPRDGAHRHRP